MFIKLMFILVKDLEGKASSSIYNSLRIVLITN